MKEKKPILDGKCEDCKFVSIFFVKGIGRHVVCHCLPNLVEKKL